MATTRDALRARFLLILVGLLLLIATIGVACNGGGDDDSSPAGSVSAEDVEDQAAAAHAQADAAAEQAEAAAEQAEAGAEQAEAGAVQAEAAAVQSAAGAVQSAAGAEQAEAAQTDDEQPEIEPGYPAGDPASGDVAGADPSSADIAEEDEEDEDDGNDGKTGPSAEAVVDPDDAGAAREPAAPLPPSEIGETEAILVPHDHAAQDEFGWSADTDGVRIISGAPLHDDQGEQSGAAYIFIRDAAGNWMQEAELLPDDGEAGAWFGRWAAIDGDVAVVGAPGADAIGDDDDAGAAYIFQRIAGQWLQTQRLLADIPKGAHQFGWSVQIDGDTIVVSASNDGDGGGQRLYVFQRLGDEWVLEAVLEPADPGADFFFAQDVGISGDTIVAGAKGRDTFAGANSGGVYVFERTDAGWIETALLEPDDAFVFDLFGRSVAIAGDTIVIGAYLEDEAGPDGGSVYVFERDPAAENGWRQDAKLIGSSTGEMDWFGYEVDTDGATIVVGAPHTNHIRIFHAGRATIFTRTAGSWTQFAEFAPTDNLTAGDSADYGWAVAVEGDVVIVGAWLADTEVGLDAGRAYAYTLPGQSP